MSEESENGINYIKDIEVKQPCPICGGHAILREVCVDSVDPMMAVSCVDCGTVGPQFYISLNGEYKAAELAATLWNNSKYFDEVKG